MIIKKNKELLEEYNEFANSIEQDEQKIIEEETIIIKKKIKGLLEQTKEEIIKDEKIKQSIVMEIRPGAGGSEASLFARDLYRMYAKLADNKNWKLELTESLVEDNGGLTYVSFLIKGNKVYNLLKNEGGVHRVQRIPKTESKGRVHTSTVSVVVLPEPTEVAIDIKPQDLKVDAYGASGPGGQHVNKTQSAIRITHLPTGIVAVSQDSRDQRVNRERAQLVLKTRLLEQKEREKQKELGVLRSTAIGTAKRSEKIRTYNWQRNQVVDHRLKNNSWNLDIVLEGGDSCKNILQKLLDWELEKIINNLLEEENQSC